MIEFNVSHLGYADAIDEAITLLKAKKIPVRREGNMILLLDDSQQTLLRTTLAGC